MNGVGILKVDCVQVKNMSRLYRTFPNIES